MEKCPMCEKGYLKKTMNKETIYGVNLGNFPAQKCSYCGEIWINGKTMEKIEGIAKERGIWGLGIRTKITRSGNSLAVRIPRKMASFLKLKEGKEAYMYPEKNKIIIESIN